MKRTIIALLLMCSLSMATVTITTVKTDELDCDGNTTAFSFDFPYAATSEVKVDVWTDAGDVATRQTETTHFSVSPSSSTSGGTVTFVTAPDDGNYVVISRTTSNTQQDDIDAGAYTSRTAIEDALDKGIRLGQEHADAIVRSIRAPQGEVGSDFVLPGALARADKLMIFSSAGVLTVASSFLPGTAVVTPFMETLLDDTDGETGLTTLGGIHVFNIKTFGAVADGDGSGGGTDNTVFIQAAADAAMDNGGVVYFPLGIYRITDSVFITDGEGFKTSTWIGERHVESTGSTPDIPVIDATNFFDRPAVIIQGARGVRMSNIRVNGGNTDPQTTGWVAGAGTMSTDPDDWIDSQDVAGQYNPYVGICIDPYGGTTPSSEFYDTGVSYDLNLSSGVILDRVSVMGFTVGVGVSPNQNGAQGDIVHLNECSFLNCYVGYGAYDDQNRDHRLTNCAFKRCYYWIDNRTYGTQNGVPPSVDGALLQRTFGLNLFTTQNATTIANVYGENVIGLGTFSAQTIASANTLVHFDNVHLKQTRLTDSRTTLFMQGSYGLFTSCHFQNSIPSFWQAGNHNIFVNCTFEMDDFDSVIGASYHGPLLTGRATFVDHNRYVNCKILKHDGSVEYWDFTEDILNGTLYNELAPGCMSVVNDGESAWERGTVYNIRQYCNFSIASVFTDATWSDTTTVEITYDDTKIPDTYWIVKDVIDWGGFPLRVTAINTITDVLTCEVMLEPTTLYNQLTVPDSGKYFAPLIDQWILPAGLTYTCDGTAVITSVSSVSDLEEGRFLVPQGETSLFRIVDITGTTVTLHAAVTRTATGDVTYGTCLITSTVKAENLTFRSDLDIIGTVDLLSTTPVSLAVNAETVIYTVPVGFRCVLHCAVLVVGANANATDISIGQNGAETDFVPATDLGNLDAENDACILEPIMATNVLKIESYVAGTSIRATVTNQAGGASNTLYLYGILY